MDGATGQPYEGHTPLERLSRKVREHHAMLHGEGGSLGLRSMVLIMWRTYVFVLMALSGGAGSLLTYLVMRT